MRQPNSTDFTQILPIGHNAVPDAARTKLRLRYQTVVELTRASIAITDLANRLIYALEARNSRQLTARPVSLVELGMLGSARIRRGTTP